MARIKCYVNGTEESSSQNTSFYHGKDTISGIALGRGFTPGSPRTTFDEATFSTVKRSADWVVASFNNQKPDQSSNPYLNFETLNGPVSLNDPAGTKIYGKKGSSSPLPLVNPYRFFFCKWIANGLGINSHIRN